MKSISEIKRSGTLCFTLLYSMITMHINMLACGTSRYKVLILFTNGAFH